MSTLLNSAITIRLLTRTDGAAYQRLRLESLQQNPEAFLSTFENESKLHERTFADHLDWAYHPPHHGYFGIFVKNELAGYVQVSKTFLDKQEHIVFLNNLYVSPKFRRQHLADQLLEHVFKELHASEYIERVFLSCTARNMPALAFYHKLGFKRYGVKVKAIKLGEQYDDEVEMVKVL